MRWATTGEWRPVPLRRARSSRDARQHRKSAGSPVAADWACGQIGADRTNVPQANHDFVTVAPLILSKTPVNNCSARAHTGPPPLWRKWRRALRPSPRTRRPSRLQHQRCLHRTRLGSEESLVRGAAPRRRKRIPCRTRPINDANRYLLPNTLNPARIFLGMVALPGFASSS